MEKETTLNPFVFLFYIYRIYLRLVGFWYLFLR